MPKIVVPLGIEFLNKIGKFAFEDNKSKEVMFTGEYNSSYDIAISTSSQDTKGGEGNALLMRTYSDRMVEITMVAKDWNLAYVAASVGSKIEYGLREMFIIGKDVKIDSTGKVVLDKIAIGKVLVQLENGSSFNVTPTADNMLDLSNYQFEDVCAKVTYAFNTNAKSVAITADGTPFIGRLLLQGKITSSLYGEVGIVEADIPSFALNGNINISAKADGTTAETTLAGVALAVSGSDCGEGMVYGYVKEAKYDDVAPQVVEIIASPSPIELGLLPSAGTETISVIGSRGGMYSDIGILNAECTFVCDTPTVATVDTTGLVTAVGAGNAEITVAYNGLSDTVEVTVGN